MKLNGKTWELRTSIAFFSTSLQEEQEHYSFWNWDKDFDFIEILVVKTRSIIIVQRQNAILVASIEAAITQLQTIEIERESKKTQEERLESEQIWFQR